MNKNLKMKFKNVPVGTWFTYKGNHYFKIRNVKIYNIIDTYFYFKNCNAVVMDGDCQGSLSGFDASEEVYAGTI